ncbi:MAG: ATP-grasp domain-containing protein [Gemmatimonadales bacterium]
MIALDAYGDLDQQRLAKSVSLRRDLGLRYTAGTIARVSRRFECDGVVYLSGLENHPEAVRQLAEGRRLWGNPPEVLRLVRRPEVLAHALRRRGFVVPALGPTSPVGARSRSHRWLLKPRRSGGGHGIGSWTEGRRVPRSDYVQERISGVPGSVIFAADGARAIPIGFSRQLVGDRSFGVSGFRYAGSILAGATDPQLPEHDRLYARAVALAQVVTEEFHLVGVNGLDFIARDGVPYPLEVNPRYSASMELAERAYGLPIFALHMQSVAGALPAIDHFALRRTPGAFGKAVVYARRTLVLGDTAHWLDDDRVRDVPHPGERIGAGQPICTVFASGPDSASCYAGLRAQAARIYRELATARRRVA